MSGAGLRATLEAAMQADGLSMKDLTVLSTQNDPFRVDTPAGHRDGAWLATHLEKLGDRRIHLRGAHYMLLGETKPNGEQYANTDEDWLWLQGKAGKAARWLGYVPFDKITDQRNSPPVIRTFEHPEPWPYFDIDLDVEIPELHEIEPRPLLDDFRGVQPYKLVLFGEKTSLEDVLAPIAERHDADLYLPTGEASDTMIHNLARCGAEDGRRTIIFYLSDCDPAGWQMAVSVSRKLQALKALEFGELEFEVRPIALTPEQVRDYGLPSTPLKPTEKRADAWKAAMGVEQTEIDSIATLKPDLLKSIVEDAIAPFHDASLDQRVGAVRDAWEEEADAGVRAQVGEEQLERLREDAAEKLATLEDEIATLNEALRVEAVDGIALPPVPEIPEPKLDPGVHGLPLIDSDWDYAEQSSRLIAHRAYENGKTT